MNYWPLLGVAVIVVGFALRFNAVPVVVVAALVSGLLSGLSVPDLLALLYKKTGRGTPGNGQILIRRDFKPAFEAPVTIAEPQRALGTHFLQFHSADPQGGEAIRGAWFATTLDNALPKAMKARLGITESSEPDRWQWVLPGPQTELWMDNWAIATGAAHPEAAHAFIDFAMVPENQLLNLEWVGYNVGAKDAQAAAEAAEVERLDMIFFTPEQLETMHEQVLNDSLATRVEIYNEVKAAAGA